MIYRKLELHMPSSFLHVILCVICRVLFYKRIKYLLMGYLLIFRYVFEVLETTLKIDDIAPSLAFSWLVQLLVCLPYFLVWIKTIRWSRKTVFSCQVWELFFSRARDLFFFRDLWLSLDTAVNSHKQARNGDEWMNEWTNERTNERTNEWKIFRIYN